MRLLVVEDDPKIASFVAKGLRQAGFAVDQVSDGEEAYRMAQGAPYDCLIVDLMLPTIDGFTLIRRLRASGAAAPVLILSAREQLQDKLEGFRAGSDDYLTKPFAFAELLARVQALLKRARVQDSATVLAVADLRVDLMARRVSRGGKEIELRPREFALLEYLVRNAGNVVSKTMILEHVWDYHFDPQTNVVDVLVHRLRSKVDRDFPAKLIHTVRGVGYVLRNA